MYKKLYKWVFEPSAAEKWWDNLPAHQKAYALKQPIWHDKDLYQALFFGIIIGFVLGFFIGMVSR